MSASNPNVFLTKGDDPRALALKMFSDVMLESYRLNTVFYNLDNQLIAVKRLGAGKSWQFPVMAFDPKPQRHKAGDFIQGQKQPFDEVIVTMDDELIAAREVPRDQTLISHFDVFAPYGRAIGKSIAVEMDSLCSRTSVQAARSPALPGFHNGGKVVSVQGAAGTRANAFPATEIGAAVFCDALSQMGELLSEDNVPMGSRYAVLTPYGKRVLMKDKQFTSRDYDPEVRNSIITQVITEVEGFKIMESNGMPRGLYSGGGPEGEPNKYDLDARYMTGNVAANTGEPMAVILCGAQEGEAAVGMVVDLDFRSVMEFEERRNVTFMKGENMVGLGVIAPWRAGEIRAQSL